ncbi:MAG: TIGR02147 family protein [Myxococcota bacterium]|nr:TIGR02147 family protein [Myxococcota bacterium]
MNVPDLYSTLDYRAWLRAWFDAKKQENPRFSHRMFVRMAKMRSPSSILQIMDGKRNLSPQSCRQLCDAMKLSAEDARTFALLVDFDQADTPEARDAAYQRLSATQRFKQAHRIEGESYRCLSRWYYPAIHELAQRPDWRAEPAWIAEQLRPPIAPQQAEEALRELQTLGMLQPDEQGTLRPQDGSLTTQQQVTGLAVHNYHRGMSARAQDAVRDFPSDQRHMLGLTVSIPAALVPQLKAELNAFQARLLDLCDGAEDHPEQVYQLNLQLFPLSKRSELE